MEEVAKEIIKYIIYPELFPPAVLMVIQIVRALFITFSVLAIALIAFLLLNNAFLEMRFINNWVEFIKAKPHRKVKMVRDWEKIVKRAKEGDESERKLAVIEADDVVDGVLDKLGYKGKDLGDRLSKLNEDIIPNISDLQRAHKTRRDIIYDPNYNLSADDSKELIDIYEKTFKDLQLF